MHKITFAAKYLKKLLQLPLLSVRESPVTPIYNNLLFEVKRDSVTITGTDVNNLISVSVPYTQEPDEEPFNFLIEAKRLASGLALVEGTEEVTITIDGLEMLVLSKGAKDIYPCEDAGMFSRPKMKSAYAGFTVKAGDLHYALSKANSIAMTDPTYLTCGVHMFTQNNQLIIESGDNQRLCRFYLNQTGLEHDIDVTTMIYSSSMLAKAMEGFRDEDCLITIGDRIFSAEFNDVKFVGMIASHQFPSTEESYTKLRTSQEVIKFGRESMFTAVRAISNHVQDLNIDVNIKTEFSEESIVLTSSTVDRVRESSRTIPGSSTVNKAVFFESKTMKEFLGMFQVDVEFRCLTNEFPNTFYAKWEDDFMRFEGIVQSVNPINL